ncbi:polyprenyl synthetase family protein [Actinocrispum sp. NPDC049592]|uniref:polyprenyl synthetase family protein n=1 Tax=Actinocrispum sp. NPDC049592 TaxID=3154835 RepID=UPI00342E512D
MTSTSVAATGSSVLDLLAWSRSLTDPGLRAAVETMPSELRLGVGYHLGWWDKDGVPAHGDGGKAIRPALVLLAARAVGGTAEHAVPAAVAVELVHNFSLVHDDIMDGDTVRRHRPTTWAAFGVPQAILVGDAMLALACQVLAKDGGVHAAEAVRWLSGYVLALCRGQSADIAFENRAAVDLADCVAMAADKTGALLSGACALGALMGGATAGQVTRLSQFGRHLGMVFQLIDDLLGIWGSPQATGKPAGNDLLVGKKSLPVAAAVASGTQAGDELAGYYARAERPRPDEIGHLAMLVETAGGRDWARRTADSELIAAEQQLTAARCKPDAAGELLMLAHLIGHRDR